MGRYCSVCTNPDLPLIDRSLASGVTLRVLSARHKVTIKALSRHRLNHLAQRIGTAPIHKGGIELIDVVTGVGDAYATAVSLRNHALHRGDTRAAMSANAQGMQALSVLADQLGIDSTATLNALRQAEVFGKALFALAPEFPEFTQRLCAHLESEGHYEIARDLRAAFQVPRPEPLPVSEAERERLARRGQRDADAQALATALVAALPRLSVAELIEQLYRRGHGPLAELVRGWAQHADPNPSARLAVFTNADAAMVGGTVGSV